MDSEESNPLLANIPEGVEHDDAVAAMQNVMGFSSFGGPQKPKRQPRNPGAGKGFGTGANSQPLQPRSTSTFAPTEARPEPSKSKPLSATSLPFSPASLPPRPPKRGLETPPPGLPSSASPSTAYFQSIEPIQAVASPTPPRNAQRTSSLNPASMAFSPRSGFSIAPFPPPKPKITVTDTSAAIALSPRSESSMNPLPPPKAKPMDSSTPHSTQANNTANTPFEQGFYRNDPPMDLDEIGYTDPTSGNTLTRRELIAYERGVLEQITNSDGTIGRVKVYFKPNFVDPNPWKDLEIKAGLRESDTKPSDGHENDDQGGA